MKVVFCGGGTGGHVYPALTVAAALRDSYPESELELLYIGVRGKMDAGLVAREGIPFRDVVAAPLRSKSIPATVIGITKVFAGAVQAWRILGAFRPDAVFATGGYGSVGVGLAAKARRLPLIVFLPDVAAGLAVKALVRIADRVAVTVAPALATMPPAKTQLTGYPVRPAFFAAKRDEARAALGLDPALPLLLVSGGSTGASAINENVASWALEFLAGAQLLHVSGQGDFDSLAAARAMLPAEFQSRYHLHAYLHGDDMARAFAAADLAVLRAGASTLGELPAARLPAVLIPGDFSDQTLNARYLESEGAAVMLPQSQLDALHQTVVDLLGDPSRREGMRDALGRLVRPDAAGSLAALISEVAHACPAVPA